jgi:hypothetical protein
MVIKGNYEQRSEQRTSQNTALSQNEETGVRKEVKAVNTTLMLLSQKINFIVRNEKVLSKNILVLNDKIRKTEEKISESRSTNNNDNNNISSEDLGEVKNLSEELNDKINNLKSDIEAIKIELDNYATKSELKEIKYLLDAINPLEFVTYKQLREMLNK